SPSPSLQRETSWASVAVSATSRRLLTRIALVSVLAHENEEELPAWSFPISDGEWTLLPSDWPDRVTREWAWGGSTGAGVRVCVLDSGIELDHPIVGRVDHSVAVLRDEEGELQVVEDDEGDLCGHGTACAGVVRALAP